MTGRERGIWNLTRGTRAYICGGAARSTKVRVEKFGGKSKRNQALMMSFGPRSKKIDGSRRKTRKK